MAHLFKKKKTKKNINFELKNIVFTFLNVQALEQTIFQFLNFVKFRFPKNRTGQSSPGLKCFWAFVIRLQVKASAAERRKSYFQILSLKK